MHADLRPPSGVRCGRDGARVVAGPALHNHHRTPAPRHAASLTSAARTRTCPLAKHLQRASSPSSGEMLLGAGAEEARRRRHRRAPAGLEPWCSCSTRRRAPASTDAINDLKLVASTRSFIRRARRRPACAVLAAARREDRGRVGIPLHNFGLVIPVPRIDVPRLRARHERARSALPKSAAAAAATRPGAGYASAAARGGGEVQQLQKQVAEKEKELLAEAVGCRGCRAPTRCAAARAQGWRVLPQLPADGHVPSGRSASTSTPREGRARARLRSPAGSNDAATTPHASTSTEEARPKPRALLSAHIGARSCPTSSTAAVHLAAATASVPPRRRSTRCCRSPTNCR